MMKQLIKWLWYLKSLKLLSSIWLIGFFGLWVSSFASAYIIPIWSYWTNMINSTTQNYDIQITTNWTFLTQHLWVTKKLLYIYNPWNILQYAFWSDNWLIYWIYNSSNQGYFKQYFLCNSAVSTNWNFNSSDCTLNVIDLTNYSWQVEVYKSFFWSLTTDDNLFYSDFMIYNWSWLPWFCVWNSSIWKSMCFIFNSYSIDWVIWTRVLENLDINVSSYWNIESELLFNPPTVSSGGWWWNSDSSNNSWILYSNQNVYNSLYKKWYRKQLCYWWFWLNDLFMTWSSSFSWIVAWSGANVFELFNTYSWWLDFNTWYDNNYLDYLYLKTFKDSYEYEWFLDKSKGLVWLWIVRDSFFKWDSFNTSNYHYFCNLVINFPWSIDTSHDSALSILDNSLSEDLISDIIWDIDILIPTSWSALGFTIKNLCESWDLTGALCSWNLDDDTDLWGSIQNSRNTWSLSWIREWVKWLLPTYIIIWFFWILILYYLRR